MRRVIFPVLLTLIVLLTTWRPDACGDKFTAGVGRGPRFQHAYAAIYPTRIVIVASPHAGKQNGIRDPKFRMTLERAGHTVSLVNDTVGLGRALSTGGADLVLADWSELANWSEVANFQSSAAGMKVIVLPVLDKPTKAETASCNQRFTCKLKTSDRVEFYLTTIDSAMKTHVKGQKS